ncbi:MAG: sulfotransferase domain-containing protein [Actinomycetota bacterium]|nr:sulfotransferase domain-containing protein [Actinomycetota bacterium]
MTNRSQALKKARFRSKAFRKPLILYRHRGLRPQDCFLAAYPRSGTTWLRFLFFEALASESAEFGSIRRAVPSVGKQRDALAVLSNGGRLIQTHERFSDIDRRVIYVVRDARDVVASEYSWLRRSGIEAGTFDDFLIDFVKGASNPWGAWGDHVEFWLNSSSARSGRLHLVKFEDLRSDTEGVFMRALEFLEAPSSRELVSTAIENNSLHRMRAKEDSARERGWRERARADIRFINTGSVAGWQEKLKPYQARLIEDRFGNALKKLGYL